MNYVIIVPVHNNSRQLEDLISKLFRYGGKENILFIDDGSEDRSAKIIRDAGCELISLGKNMGKGMALRCGMKAAADRSADFVITLDGDGQHDPKKIPDFLNIHKAYPHDILIGYRKRTQSEMPFMRKMSNAITSTCLSHRVGQTLYDSQCGFRCIPAEFYTRPCSKRSGFMFESETLIAWSDMGAVFRHIDIPTIYAQSQDSSMTHLYTTLDFCCLYISALFRKYGNKHGN